MKSALFLLALVPVSTLSGCFSNCDEDCDQTPDKGELVVKVTIDDTNPYVVVELYKGQYVKNQFIRSDTLRKERKVYTFDTNQLYAVKAYYAIEQTVESGVIEKHLEPKIDFCDCVIHNGKARFDFRIE